ncbi:MAG: GntR family transcriptional regulator [Candidatus Dormiibacterota bacterium]
MSDAAPARGPIPLDRSNPLPLWAQLAADLRRRIGAGEFSSRFPTEAGLVIGYQVSRHTVREALRDLRSQGLVDSRRGLGTRVIEPRFHQPLGALYSLFRFVEAQGAEQRSEVRVLESRLDATVARRLGLGQRTPLVYLERLRLANGRPLALDRAWVPQSFGEPLLSADFSHGALYDQMAGLCRMRPDHGREEIRALVPQPADRHLLCLPHGVAAFHIERLAYAGQDPVEWRSTLIRADLYSFSVEWLGASAMRVDVRRQREPDPPPPERAHWPRQPPLR